ncbi:MAG: MFS transporter, partial [Verrucomicrobiae bacterium]|nr:MFS transporter [Verrucomicrobiae bacterium]
MNLPENRWQHLLLIGSILLIAINLRPAITVLSPLAERMRGDGLSREVIGAMTTIPLILFGVAGLWAGWLGGRFGLARSLGAGLMLVAGGCFLRSVANFDFQGWRFAGTILIGAGVALGNVLLPGLVKSRYPEKIGLLTSLYSSAMNLGAALGIAVAVPLADSLAGGWSASIGSWGILALATVLLWLPQMLPRPTKRRRSHPLAGVATLARRKRAWQVAAFMGLQSSVYYSAVAWLPAALQARGMSEAGAAGWVTGMQVLG